MCRTYFDGQHRTAIIALMVIFTTASMVPGAICAADAKLEGLRDSLQASTFFGGSGGEGARIAISPLGDVYVYGVTSSADLPIPPDAFDTTYNGGDSDLYVARFDADLTTLMGATYLGGSARDEPGWIDFDAEGNVFVAGMTMSTDFPVTVGAYDTTPNGYSDIVVSKFDAGLTTMMASTYLGGSLYEGSNWGDSCLCVDGNGDVVVANFSNSANYPTTPGAFDRTYNDYDTDDVVISKLDNDLTTLLASTFLGGGLWDLPYTMELDAAGNIVIGGRTSSSNFPVSAGAYHANYSDPFPYYDGFVSRLSSDLTTLQASTYIGSTSQDITWGLDVAADGRIYICGSSESAAFPTTVGAYDTTYNGGSLDGFISCLSADMSSLLASTFLGGSGNGYQGSLTLDGSGQVHAGGHTESADFPVTADAFLGALNGTRDGTYVRMDADLSMLHYATFIGGSDTEGVGDPCLDAAGRLYLPGSTASPDFPVSPGAFDTTHNGGGDIFITRLESGLIQTATAGLSFLPDSGTVPFATQISVTLGNPFTGATRRVAARIDVTLANGQFFAQWKAGVANIPAGGSYAAGWSELILDNGTMTGLNSALLIIEDVTPAPYNQPPFPASGYVDTASCTVEGIAP